MKLLVYGSREYAGLVRDHLLLCGHEFCGFIDDESTGPSILGTYETVLRTHPPTGFGLALGIGYKNLAARRVVLDKLGRDGWRMPALIHPRAWVRDPDAVGSGGVIMAMAAVELNAIIEPGCVLWSNVVVSHDSRVGSNTFLSPGTIVCGFARIGRDCFVGAGALVVDHASVADGAFVRAGKVCR